MRWEHKRKIAELRAKERDLVQVVEVTSEELRHVSAKLERTRCELVEMGCTVELPGRVL
jgi:hypothetical protein